MLALRLSPNLEAKPVHGIKFVTPAFKRNPERLRMCGKESVYILENKVEFFSLYHVLYFFVPKIWLHKLLSEEHQ
jgi:hypothetical protein